MKKIILTGGGTAGHVTPNIALLPKLVQENFEVFYIGGHNGFEKELIEKTGVPYYGVSSGKLRRYLSIKNITDSLQVLKGINEAKKVIEQIKPDVIFSKGGFVTVPVVIAARMCGIPVVLHESDITPGLANKLSIPFCNKICVTFPETLNHVSKKKGVLTGSPIRKSLFAGDSARGFSLCGFSSEKPVFLVMGGSQGSKKMNEALRAAMPQLLTHYQIVHICGKGNADLSAETTGYKQFEYVDEQLRHLFAMATCMVSRAGSNAISEFLALQKPNLLIPLSKKVSRGDQILNAHSFEKQGFSKILPEENLTIETLVTEMNDLYYNRQRYIERMEKSPLTDGVDKVVKVILSSAK